MNYITEEKKTVELKVTETVERKSVAQIPFDNMVVSEDRYLRLNAKAWRAGESVDDFAKVRVTSSRYLSDDKVVLRQGKEVVALITMPKGE